MKTSIYALLSLLIICWTTSIISANNTASHPWKDYFPVEPTIPYKWYDLQDIRTESLFFEVYSDISELSDMELMMLFKSSNPKYRALGSWSEYIFQYVDYYYWKFGRVPDVLSPDVLADAYGMEWNELDQEFLETLKSPVSGDYPILNAKEFSKGNLYVRVITKEEMNEISQKSDLLCTEWKSEKYYDSQTGSELIWKVGPVYYWVVHGVEDTILRTLMYKVELIEPDE